MSSSTIDQTPPLDAEEVSPAEAAPPEERAYEGHPYRNPVRLAVLIGLAALLGISRGGTILVVVAAVVIMIFFHELGHYLAARRSGMMVTEFFIGFGPRIFSFVKGETEYGLKAIPAGAYVKVIGMANVEEVDPALEPRTYRQGSYFDRVRLAIAGPASHFVMAFMLLFAYLVFEGAPSEESWVVGSVAEGSAADEAGLQPGDTVLELAGTDFETFEEMAVVAQANPLVETTVVIERDGERMEMPIVVKERLTIYGTIGQDLVVFLGGDGDITASVPEGSPLDQQGFADGSIITEINGTPVASIEDVSSAIETAETGKLDLVLAGTTGPIEQTIDMGSEVAPGDPSGFFGIGQELEPEPVGVLEAVPRSAEVLWSVTTQSVSGLADFFTPSSIGNFVERAFSTTPGEETTVDAAEPASVTASNENAENEGRVMSIFGAVRIGEEVTKSGWMELLTFMVQLNIVIGLFNLIPLPPFDGGHIVVATYEKIRELFSGDRKRYISDANKLMPVAYGVLGFFLLIGIMAIYLDFADPVSI